MSLERIQDDLNGHNERGLLVSISVSRLGVLNFNCPLARPIMLLSLVQRNDVSQTACGINGRSIWKDAVVKVKLFSLCTL